MNLCAFIVQEMMSQVELYFGQSAGGTHDGAVTLFPILHLQIMGQLPGFAT